MHSPLKTDSYKWLYAGDEIFPALLAALRSAQKTIRFESYIYENDAVGQQFRDALGDAVGRGVKVQILIDAFGSISLAASFWQALMDAGAEVRWFNPLAKGGFGFRDHRKLVVLDDAIAFIGGFNISASYSGDGLTSGWCDLGLQITSPLAAQFGAAFDDMFARSDFKHRRFMRLRRSTAKNPIGTPEGDILLSGPGRGRNPFLRALHRDLVHARSVQIVSAYFLPTARIRRDLARIARRGGHAQLILPGKSDVVLSQLAGRSLYRRLLRAGVEIYEYQLQILHAKLIIIDGAVFAGSSNLDPRSLHINYELTLRLQNKELTNSAHALFGRILQHSQRIELAAWRKSRTWWERLKSRWAYFLLARVDPWLARRQYKRMPG